MNDYFQVIKDAEICVSVYEQSKHEPQSLTEKRTSRPRLWLDLDGGPKRDSISYSPFMPQTFTMHSTSPSQRSSVFTTIYIRAYISTATIKSMVLLLIQ